MIGNTSIDTNKTNNCFIKDYFENPTLDFLKFSKISISECSLSYSAYIPFLNVSTEKELEEKLEENLLFISDKNYDKYFENCILIYKSSILFKNWFNSLTIDLSSIVSFKLKKQEEDEPYIIKIKLEIKDKNNNSIDFFLCIPDLIVINKKEYKLNFNIVLLIQHINSLLFKHLSNYNKNKDYKNNI